jgi:hypothetical protein
LASLASWRLSFFLVNAVRCATGPSKGDVPVQVADAVKVHDHVNVNVNAYRARRFQNP